MTEAPDMTGVEAPPPGRKRGRRLSSLRDVRGLLAYVVRQLEADSPAGMPKPGDRVARARALIYAAQVLGELVKATDLEERIAALEERGSR